MKKFVFTLESVYKYKLTMEKKQKAELRKAQDVLRKLLQKDRELDLAKEKNTLSLENALKKGQNIPSEMQRHDDYFKYIRNEKELITQDIIEAQKEKDKAQQILIETMKEIKVFEKLKEEQYRKYLEEVAQEEAKVMSDLVSFQTITDDED